MTTSAGIGLDVGTISQTDLSDSDLEIVVRLCYLLQRRTNNSDEKLKL